MAWWKNNREDMNRSTSCISNPGTPGYLPSGAGAVEPREYDQPLFCVLHVDEWLQEGYPPHFSYNGVVLTDRDSAEKLDL